MHATAAEGRPEHRRLTRGAITGRGARALKRLETSVNGHYLDCLRSTFPLREMGLKASFLLGSLLTGLRAPAGSRRAPQAPLPSPLCVQPCA